MVDTSQLAFDLGLRPAHDREDFLVSESNAAALEMIERWPDWGASAAVIVGPEGSGKTHLTHVWQSRSNATRIAAAALVEHSGAAPSGAAPLIVEDIDRGIGHERALFHLLNSAREHEGYLLLTSRQPPGDLDIGLPDLRSRLRALPIAVIEPPDEMLMRAVLVKLFADRQLAVDPPVIAYLALHAERSMAALTRLVALVDDLSLTLQRRVTRTIAAAAVRQLYGQDHEAQPAELS